MLTTETYTIDAALEELNNRIADVEEKLDDLDDSTDRYQALASRRSRLQYRRDGLRWQRDEEGWGGDATIELGAMTAGEEAIMHRSMSNNPNRKERRLWFVAASTVDAPYGVSRDPNEEPLTESVVDDNFAALAGAGIHGGFAQWAEAVANGLGIPGGSGNASNSSTSSQETQVSETSTTEQNSTTTSSSGSPTE